jgi:phenylalanyl-tRNA synthetase beta chain
MNIQILDSWLRDLLETDAKPDDIARSLSLCGPSVERVDRIKLSTGKVDFLYDIEITTNRVDAMSVYGIAREAQTILPQFGFKAKLKEPKLAKIGTPQEKLKLNIKTNKALTGRIMAVVLDNIENWATPLWMKERLEASGIRSLNAVVDITNYVMTEIGHPTHVFDYDLVKTHSFIIRESKKNEKIISLDSKEYTLPLGSIVIEDGTGKIIDLPGIIGTKNSVVNTDTKRIVFFIDNNDPLKIRKASMTLGIRTVAATLNEKGVDPELADKALQRGIKLYNDICKAQVASKVYDIYPSAYEPKELSVGHGFITSRLGVTIPKEKIAKILTSLGFSASWKNETLFTKVPSFRAKDINIPEDIIEEIARIYGFFNLPSELMTGKLPEKTIDNPFDFEIKIKRALKAKAGIEIYTLSLVPKNYITNALKLKNPLGSDSEYLRTSLKHSLFAAAEENKAEEKFHLFEMANIYLPRTNKLPEEKMKLAGILKGYSYREAKGLVEALLDEFNIKHELDFDSSGIYSILRGITFRKDSKNFGNFGELEEGYFYYEFDMELLKSVSSAVSVFTPPPKYPPQIEDLTLLLPDKTKVGDIISTIEQTKLISKVELTDIYENAHTFRVFYQHPKKTLTNKEVEKTRIKMLKTLKTGYSVILKD